MKSKSLLKSVLSLILSIMVILSMTVCSVLTASAVDGVSLDYVFKGNDAETPGYAQGTVTLSSDKSGEYYLYWADDVKALEGYYEIAKLSVEANGSAQFDFGYHTVIPADATKIIATTDKNKLNVSDAQAVYQLPEKKLLSAGSGKLKYTFSSYSDVHVDPEGFYKNYDKKWTQALNYSAKKGTDFIVTSGDMVNYGSEYEWSIYQQLVAESNYENPIYESDGNHDLRNDVTTGLKSFVRATGTDNTIANFDANKPYYYVTEKTTGDIFIFMALESNYKTHTVDCFSQAQIQWVTNLVGNYYGTGVNIYIIEHAAIKGFGAGDRMDNPWYQSHLSEEFQSTRQFKELLQKYPKLIWMSGHTHIDFAMGYNYSNENGTACHTIHNPAVIGSTWAEQEDTALDYKDGYGYNSQGYYVEVYNNQVIYYGANLTDEKIYPAYSYIMDGARNVYPIGDTDLSGNITVEDATLIQKYLAKYEVLDSRQKRCADVNADGKISVNDATYIQMYIAQIIEKFPEKVEDQGSVENISKDITALLSSAKTHLEKDYEFASYSQYMAVKKLYNQYKNSTTAFAAVAQDFEEKIAELTEIVNHIGDNGINKLHNAYYFVNKLGWSSVYGYGWTGSAYKVAWPGEQLQKVGTYEGYDVYGIRLDRVGQCQNLIFNNGSGTQTVDINLLNNSGNCFVSYSGDTESGKFRAYNLNFDDSNVQWEDPIPGADQYALCYYNNTAHGWTDIDTYFEPVGDGTFKLEFTTKNANSISCNVYDTVSKKYNCIAVSTGFDFATGTKENFTLGSSDSRGKSITINNLSAGLKITFIYNPTDNTLNITCG